MSKNHASVDYGCFMDQRIFVSTFGALTYRLVGNGDRYIVMIPSGAGQAEVFDKFTAKLSRKYKILLVDLPGATNIHFVDAHINTIVLAIKELVESLKINNFAIIGMSYGGNVALHLVQAIKAKGLVLITCGEYFSNWQKKLLKIIFFPALIIKSVRPWYAKIVTRMKLVDFSQSDAFDYENIMKRWWEIISYTLPEFKIQREALIFEARHDKIINRKSLEKIKNIFQNRKIVEVDSGHLNILDKLSEPHIKVIEKYLDNLFSQNIPEQANRAAKYVS